MVKGMESVGGPCLRSRAPDSPLKLPARVKVLWQPQVSALWVLFKQRVTPSEAAAGSPIHAEHSRHLPHLELTHTK